MMREVGEIPGTARHFISGGLVLLVDSDNCSPFFRVGRVGTLTRPHEWGGRPIAPLLVRGLIALEGRIRPSRDTVAISAAVNARAMLEDQLKKQRGRSV
jgi:hypothetical protein